MLNEAEEKSIEKGLITQRILWAMMLISLCMYVGVAHLAGEDIRQEVEPYKPLDLLRNIFYGISVVAFFASFLIRKMILSVRAGSSRQITVNPSQNRIQPTASGKYSIAMIVSLALSESIGIYGLVLYFLGDSLQTFYTFIGVSALAMFFHRPQKQEVITLANNIKTKQQTIS